MKKILLVGICTIILAGCRAGNSPGTTVESGATDLYQIKYVHDETNHVGLWYVVDEHGSSGIGVLPDDQYLK